MKVKLLYVLVSSNKDIYLEQFYVSSYSAKKKMPDCFISLLVDNQTKQSFTEDREFLLEFADEIVEVQVSNNYTKQQKSRFLKTSAREHVKGDFLFIDTDTIIVRPLYEIENLNCSIAACEDSHSSFNKNPYRYMCLTHGNLLEWPIDKEEIYYNSGVIFVKDDAIAHEFYKMWNEEWQKGVLKGVSMDQPSFAKTNYFKSHLVFKMDDTWNCQIIHGIKYLKDAKIVHYLYTNKGNQSALYRLKDKSLFETISRERIIPKEISEIIDDPFTGLPRTSLFVTGNDIGMNLSKEYDELLQIKLKNRFIYKINCKLISFFHKIINKL